MMRGRPTLFSHGEAFRVNGHITEKAGKRFEELRGLIRRLSGFAKVSDGNVVETMTLAAKDQECARVILRITNRESE